MSVALNDYAGCNGNLAGGMPGNGAVVSQANGRATISTSDVKDGVSYTLLLGEKAANPRNGTIYSEDDMGYFSSYNGGNYNTVRFTDPNFMPLKDYEVKGQTGGSFGSPHASAFQAVMCDGSVTQISFTINSGVFSALGTIAGREIISDTDLSN
jgi:hypothetical protein